MKHLSNSSKLFLQGYPTFEEDDEEDEGKRRSLRIRTRQRDDLIEEDVAGEQSDTHEQIENETINDKETNDAVESSRLVKKDSKSVITLQCILLNYSLTIFV